MSGDTAEHLPAAQAAAVIERRRDDVRRRLDLAARMTVEVEPVERDAVVRAETSYVLTKAVLPARDGTATPLHEETISFTTGQSASFPVGTTCQPNGRFEDLVFDALPAMFMAGS